MDLSQSTITDPFSFSTKYTIFVFLICQWSDIIKGVSRCDEGCMRQYCYCVYNTGFFTVNKVIQTDIF